jgi:hypothetical protein
LNVFLFKGGFDMRIFVVSLVLVFASCSFVFAGEEAQKKDERIEVTKPIIERLKERREEQRKSNIEFFKAEVGKLEISEEKKKEIINRFESRMKKMAERCKNHRERFQERRGKRDKRTE